MTTEELEIWKRLNECECVKRVFGWWEIGDLLWDDYGEEFGYVIGKQETEFTGGRIEITARVEYFSGLQSNIRRDSIEKYFIPPLYDPIRPDRSLIGMVKGIVILRHTPWLKENCWVCEILDPLSGVKDQEVNAHRPDLALAKAIIEQEGSHDRE